jgi:hypothetical protein
VHSAVAVAPTLQGCSNSRSVKFNIVPGPAAKPDAPSPSDATPPISRSAPDRSTYIADASLPRPCSSVPFATLRTSITFCFVCFLFFGGLGVGVCAARDTKRKHAQNKTPKN